MLTLFSISARRETTTPCSSIIGFKFRYPSAALHQATPSLRYGRDNAQVVKINVEDHNPPRLTQIVHFIETAAKFTEVTDDCSVSCETVKELFTSTLSRSGGSKPFSLRLPSGPLTGGPAQLHRRSLQGRQGPHWHHDIRLAHVQVGAEREQAILTSLVLVIRNTFCEACSDILIEHSKN